MPTYGYRCATCGHQFEIVQRISEEPLKECPKCQGKLTKVLYPTGVIFKGSGFYSTDYKAGGKAAAEGGNPSSNGSTSSSESKPDSKPESKPESKSESKD